MPSQAATDKSLSSTSTKQPSSDLHGTSQTVVKPQSTGKSLKGRPTTDHTSDLAGTNSPTVHQVTSRSSAPARRQSPISMDTDSDSDFSGRPPVDIFVEEGELSDQDPDATATDPDQTLSEEQNYRETMRGIRSAWIQQQPHQMTTPLLGPKHNYWARCRSKCLLTSGYVGRWANSTLLWWKDILHVARKQEVFSKISLFDQPDLRANGMGLCPTNRKVILELVKLFHHGVQTLPKSTAPIAV